MDHLVCLFALVVFLCPDKALGLGEGGDVRCFDCNYDPASDDVISYGSYQRASERGFARCSLEGVYDDVFVDHWPCHSGTCFIRKDSDGLVYRGCADSWNLPWGVDSQISCEPQGRTPSTWWFCQGDRCNKGAFGVDVCPESSTNQSPGVMETIHGEPPSNDFTGKMAYDSSHSTNEMKSYRYQAGVHNDDSEYARTADMYSDQTEYSKTNDGYGHQELPVWDTFKYHHPLYSWTDYGQNYPDMNSYPSRYYHSKSYYSSGEQPLKPSEDIADDTLATIDAAGEDVQYYSQGSNYWPYDKSNQSETDFKKSNIPSVSDIQSDTPTYPMQSKPEVELKKDTPSKKSDSIGKSWDSAYLTLNRAPNTAPLDTPVKGSLVFEMKEPKLEEQLFKSYQPSYKGEKPPTKTNQKSSTPNQHSTYAYGQPTKNGVNHSDLSKKRQKQAVGAEKEYNYINQHLDKHLQSSKAQSTRSKSSQETAERRGSKSNLTSKQPPGTDQPSTRYEAITPRFQQQPSKYVSQLSKSYKRPSKLYQTSSESYEHPVKPVPSLVGPKPSELPEPQSKSYQIPSNPDQQSYKSNQPMMKSYQRSKSYQQPPIHYHQSKYYQPHSAFHQHSVYGQSPPQPKASQQNLKSYPNPPESGPSEASTSPVPMTTPPVEQEYIYGMDVSSKGMDDQSNHASSHPSYDWTSVYKSLGWDTGRPTFERQVMKKMKEGNNNLDKMNKENGLVGDIAENPCDYRCEGNPSGLFEHPGGGSWFIQCGASMEEGKACKCCKPYFLRCPNGTVFDPRTRVCSERIDSSNDKKQYKVLN